MLLVSGEPALAADPSFDCDGARSNVEKMICGDDELAALDVKLAKTFAKVLSMAPADGVSELKMSQKSWRQQMIKCGDKPDPRACVVQSYNKRMSGF
ncbi:lysozyme inhibitor LprI family protein [Oryzibacter oryziterrae]|uniref:lysozyme inhibitor LprI family protein n=1 Tax=Oryzibacter oryziterrae TaxID=2766474 RepID=UPI001F488A97|nr:hypothetical protein [Oryzibacter oryziterrae]